MDTDKLLVTEKDYLRLDNLISSYEGQDLEDLEVELNRATIISDQDVPADLVTMNSRIKYLDLTSNKETIVSIVYPKSSEASKSDEGNVSILAPLGSALLGLQKGQEINWRFPNGKTRRLKIVEIIYQPEAEGDWHL